MTNFTKEQQQVIKTKNKNLLVSASAGSGKTFTMIARILKLLKEGSSLENMLIVTFTNAAASEMKKKIYEEVAKEVKNHPHLEEEVNKLPTADISTLHNFCSKIIRQNFYEVGVDPAFKILDEAESSVLMSGSLTNVLNDYMLKNDKQFDKLYETYNKHRRDLEFKNSIIKLYRFLKSKYNYKEFVKQIVDSTYTSNLNKNIAGIYLFNNFKEQLAHFEKQFSELTFEASTLKEEKLLSVLSNCLNLTKELIKTKNFEELFKLINNLPSLPRMPGKVGEDAAELKEEISETKQDFKTLIDDIKKQIAFDSFNNIKQNQQKAKEQLNKMLEVVIAFDDYYKNIKKDRALLDFNDLEYYALQVLENKKIANVIKDRYEHIFIDEYQDTNNIQEEIIKKISKENNVFMVGDVKQSIYMFRQCDPQIFVNKYESFKTQTKSQKIDLNENFRSDKTILNFANFVFNNIMKQKTASVNYEKTAQFVAGAKYKAKINNLPKVSVNVINKTKKQNKEKEDLNVYSVKNHTQTKTEAKNAVLEARVVANKINDFVGSKIYDTKLNDYRKVEFEDIAILSRTRGEYIKLFVEELKKCNIPVFAKYKDKVFKTYEAQLINNYLRLINNENDDIAIVSVLASFMFKVSFDELSEIRLKENKKQSFYECIENYIKNHKDKVTTKILQLKEHLNYFRQRKKFLTVAQLIKEIIEKYELENYFLALPDGKKMLANVNMIINVANSKELRDYLFKYVNYVETFEDDEEFEISTNQGQNSVTVTTIHSSKGLEYPVVILTNAGKDFTKKPFRGEILINKDLGFGVKHYDLKNRMKTTTIARNAIKENNKEQELAEEMRLLYVAITRAKNHLVVVGTDKIEKLKKLSSAYSVKNAKSYIEWMLGSLKKQHLNSFKMGKKTLKVNLDNNTHFELNNIDVNNIKSLSEKQKMPILNKSYDIYLKEFEKTLNFEYANKNSIDVVAKSSVTEIMQANEEENYNYRIKKFMVNEINKTKQELDFSLIGNVYHKVMQHINFGFDKKEQITELIKSLIDKNELPSNAFEIVDVDVILKATKDVNKLIDKGDEVLREKQFIMYVPYDEVFKESQVKDKILIQGVVDLIIVKNNKAIVIDYKTSRIENEQKLKQKYAIQLDLYKKATENALKIKVENKFIYSLYLKRMVNV